MKKIDFHVHAFPDSVAPRALSALTSIIGNINRTDGTLAGAIKRQEEWGSEKFVLLNVPTTPAQQEKANDFLIAANGGKIISFGSPHPLAANALYELDRIVDAGLPGVKFHPEYQGFDMDDPMVYPLYEACAKKGLIMLFHGGRDPAFVGGHRSSPKRAAKMAKDFDGAKIVIAHLGDSYSPKETLEYLCGMNLYLDVSMAPQVMTKAQFASVIKAHGTDKILYATDCPWGGDETQRMIDSLELSESDRENIYYRNAEKLLGI